MNRKWILMGALASFLLCGGANAAYVYFGPSITFAPRQPVQAVFIDANGNSVERTCCYNSEVGGIDIGDTTYSSVYFPGNNVRYLYADGYWVDESGYYWNGGRRYYYDHPGWNDHWHGYWRGGGYGGGWHDGWRGGGGYRHGGGHGGHWHR